MVLQELSQLWPSQLSPRLCSMRRRVPWASEEDQAEFDGTSSAAFWELFDSAEKGLPREEVPEELLRPCGAGRLQRFYVARSDGNRKYRLFTSNGDLLMSAWFSLTEPKVEIFVSDPCEKGSDETSCPTFTMTCNQDRSSWLLVQEQAPAGSPRGGSRSPRRERRQLALVRHFREAVGGGSARCMEVALPSHKEGARGDCAGQVDLACGSGVEKRLVTRLPEWDGLGQSLTLDFDERRVQASAKNFQLACSGAPEEAIFQHGKIDDSAFCLDFKAPLGIVQAFATALTAAYWT